MTERAPTAEPAGLGWPEAREQVAADLDTRGVSRETSVGLGWPEDRV